MHSELAQATAKPVNYSPFSSQAWVHPPSPRSPEAADAGSHGGLALALRAGPCPAGGAGEEKAGKGWVGSGSDAGAAALPRLRRHEGPGYGHHLLLLPPRRDMAAAGGDGPEALH